MSKGRAAAPTTTRRRCRWSSPFTPGSVSCSRKALSSPGRAMAHAVRRFRSASRSWVRARGPGPTIDCPSSPRCGSPTTCGGWMKPRSACGSAAPLRDRDRRRRRCHGGPGMAYRLYGSHRTTAQRRAAPGSARGGVGTVIGRTRGWPGARARRRQDPSADLGRRRLRELVGGTSPLSGVARSVGAPPCRSAAHP